MTDKDQHAGKPPLCGLLWRSEPGCCVAHDWGRHLAESAPDDLPDGAAATVLAFIDGVQSTGRQTRRNAQRGPLHGDTR